jgi:GDP-4-dehydro-6-deoxy-D-mannose reductase
VTVALITGATGFAGSFLVEECLAAGWEVHGTRPPGAQEDARSEPVYLHALDLRDAAAIERLVAGASPDCVFHLAAQASVSAAWADPAATLTDNLLLAQRVLNAVRVAAPRARVLVVCSGEEYGRAHEGELPLREDHPLRPLDPYAVSKVAVDYLALQHHLAHRMHVVRVRPFNHIGPRQRQGFVVADFASQLAAIERGDAPPVLSVGNLEAARDFTDVRDVVRAYRLALERGVAGAVYNVCSGRAIRIAEILRILVAACRVPVDVRPDPARYRPVDYPVVFGSSEALRAGTGWEPIVPIETSLHDTLAYWRAVTER